MEKLEMTKQGDAPVQHSLDRLLLANQIRELADYSPPVKVTDLSVIPRLLGRLGQLTYSTPASSRARLNLWRHVLIGVPIIALLQLFLYRWNIRRAIWGTLRFTYKKMRRTEPSSSEITGYITSTDKENPLIRVCLLLRVMKRYGVCVELLIRRFNSGLTSTQTRQWLSFFLREIGDTKTADEIAPNVNRGEEIEYIRNSHITEQSSSTSSSAKHLKYGVVITTMFDTDVFRSSVLSLLNSDFQGDIVVAEDGNKSEMSCQSFCNGLPIKYVKNPSWLGLCATVNLGVEQLDPATDIVIHSHSDVLWPPHWFSQLNNAWEKVHDLDKVQQINLGVMDLHRNTDAALTELFVQGNYQDLSWAMRAASDAEVLMAPGWNVQVKDTGRMFGLAKEVWHDRPGMLRLMTGRISPGGSFLMQTWRDLGGLDPGLIDGINWELTHDAIQKRRWGLWMNNTPLIHLRGGDTHQLTGSDRTRWIQMKGESQELFLKKYGWDVYHYEWTYFAETTIIYHDEIINAANELRFQDIDFIFDDFHERLQQKRLATCELVWCPSRGNCKYI